MKTAYELAMERLQAEDPNTVYTLTDEQREAIAELEQRHKAKLAEREIFLERKLQEEIEKSNFEEAEKLRTELKNERERLNEELEAKKGKVRKKS